MCLYLCVVGVPCYLSLSFGSSKRGDTVAMDTIAPVMGELLVQGDVSERAVSLNVDSKISPLFVSLSLQSCNTCKHPVCVAVF